MVKIITLIDIAFGITFLLFLANTINKIDATIIHHDMKDARLECQMKIISEFYDILNGFEKIMWKSDGNPNMMAVLFFVPVFLVMLPFQIILGASTFAVIMVRLVGCSVL